MAWLVVFLSLVANGAAGAPRPTVQLSVTGQYPNLQLRAKSIQLLHQRSRKERDQLVIDLYPAHFPGVDHRNLGPIQVEQLTEDRLRIRIPTEKKLWPKAVVDKRGCQISWTLCPAAPSASPPKALALRQPRITEDFIETDIVDVYRKVVRTSGWNHCITGGIQGKLSVSFKQVPWEGALRTLNALGDQPCELKLLQTNTVMVGAPEMTRRVLLGRAIPAYQTELRRETITIQYANVPRLVQFLESQYRSCRFYLHPCPQAFFVVGSKEDIIQIKRELEIPVRASDSHGTQICRAFLKISQVNVAAQAVRQRFSGVEALVDLQHSILILEGEPKMVEAAIDSIQGVDFQPEHLPDL